MLVLGACGKPDDGSQPEPYTHVAAPSLIQDDCEGGGGTFFHFIEKTCDTIGTACITRVSSDLYFDGKLLPSDSCMSEYLTGQGL